MRESKLDKMRKDISKAYPGKQWRLECLYFMPAKQVIAIWHNLDERGKLKKNPKEIIDTSYQMSIWDLGIDLYGKKESGNDADI